MNIAPSMLQRRVPLTLDALKQKVPSVFATKASPKMGDRYTFIPSHVVVEGLDKMGLVPVDAQQRRSREATSARHLIRFARRADLQPSKARTVGEVIPEVVFSNSHNGRCRASLYFGMFRLVCANGLIVADKMFTGMARRHAGELAGILEEVEEVLGQTNSVIQRVTVMRQTVLTPNARTQFAMRALELRYADPETGKVVAPITAQSLLVPRRPDDDGMDLWRTFNVVQENLLRGGVEGKSANGRVVHTREVQDVRKVVNFNTELWSLAVERIAA